MSVFYDLNKTPRNILNQAIVRAIVSESNGALFDPSDMSTMFQDAAGTIPVTAVEQPVGLMLDKVRGLMLGPELVSNGTFDTDASGWTPTGIGVTNYTIDSGTVIVTTNAVSGLAQAVPTEVGKLYRATVKLKSISGVSGSCRVDAPLGPPVAQSASSSSLESTTVQVIFKATSSQTTLCLRVSSAGTFSFDEVSTRELYGYHATQPITASRPTLSARYNLLTKTEDFSDAVWGSEINLTTTSNTAIAPDGTLTADTITTTAVTHAKFQVFTCVPNTQYTFSFYAKRGTMTDAKYSVYDLTGASNIVAATSYYSAINAGTFSRVSITFTTPANCISCRVYPLRDSGVIGTIHMWGADVRLGLSGHYQRVNTKTDYDTDERYFKKYLRFDGVDDYLNLPYMGLYAAGSASVIAARDEKSSHAIETYTVSERSTLANAPYYLFDTKPAGVLSCGVIARNDSTTTIANTISSALSSVSNSTVMSYIDNGANIKRFKNSILATSSVYVRSGTLTPNNTTIGAFVVSTGGLGFMNNNLYGLIITKSAITDAQRIKCERYAASKSGVIL